MRRYTLSINGREHVVEVDEITADTFQVKVGDQVVDVSLTGEEGLTQAQITPEIEARPTGKQHPASAVVTSTPKTTNVPSQALGTRPENLPRPPRGASRATTLTAPMPGVVISVETTVGAQVKRGDVLLILEAMKMKNTLKATRDGTIAEIFVSAGQQVYNGDVLLRFGEA